MYAPGGQPSSRLDEHGSMEEQFGHNDLKFIREKLNLPRKEILRRPKRVRQKCSLFPTPEYHGANFLDDWLKQLAMSDRPLSKLAKEVPYISSTGFSRGREVLNKLSEHQVPLLRAAWFVKVTVRALFHLLFVETHARVFNWTWHVCQNRWVVQITYPALSIE
jgi:hypothetical protein